MNWIQRFMYGRYGFDKLGRVLLTVDLLLSLLGFIINTTVINIVTLALFLYTFYRIASKRYEKRRNENEVFLRFYQPLENQVMNRMNRFKDNNHKYYNCPKCKKTIRVPKGKGKICITCPVCREEFIRKT